MRKLREILRLKHEVGLKPRHIARSCGLSPTTLYDYLRRAEQAGIGWPIPAEWDDQRLEETVFGAEDLFSRATRPLPEMAYLHRELRRKGVTRQLLWEEYRREHPQGYAYTQFCEYYERWCQTLDPSLRQEHIAGERMFVDWAGQTIPVGGDKAYLFVAVLGASNYTYAEAFDNTRMPAWIEAHIHAYEYFGGVPLITVPDNARTAVSRACRYDPDTNPTYRDMAEHYRTVIIPTRPYKPKDKPKAENAVLNAERRILAVLRDQSFFNVGELNRSIRPLLEALNERPFQKLAGSRRSLFEALDKPALQPLPATRYELCEWHKGGVNIDYHVQVDWHWYSVPHQLVGQPVEVRLTARMVEILHSGKRVAMHARSYEKGRATTLDEHRPKSHQRHLDWTPGRLIHWAQNEVGAQCAVAVRAILEAKPHPEQGYRSCLGIMRLAKGYGATRMEAACGRALALGACSYRSIASMLKTGLDRQPLPEEPTTPTPAQHPNIRGGDYYQYRNAQSPEENEHVA